MPVSDKKREYDQQYYKKHRKKRLAYARTYRLKNLERIKQARQGRIELTREPRRAYHLFSRYGLTSEEYQKMAEDQGYACKICRRPAQLERFGKLHVDHVKGTKVVRGLLCDGCNLGLGKFRDSPQALSAAIEYLRVTAL